MCVAVRGDNQPEMTRKEDAMKIKFDTTPCEDAEEWLETQPDIQTAWATCERGDWLWWALLHSGNVPPKRTSVAFAKWCAERAREYAYAAYDAADDAAHDKYAAFAAADAAAAVAADNAYAAAYAGSAAASAADAELLAQADWIRKHVKCPKVH